MSAATQKCKIWPAISVTINLLTLPNFKIGTSDCWFEPQNSKFWSSNFKCERDRELFVCRFHGENTNSKLKISPIFVNCITHSRGAWHIALTPNAISTSQWWPTQHQPLWLSGLPETATEVIQRPTVGIWFSIKGFRDVVSSSTLAKEIPNSAQCLSLQVFPLAVQFGVVPCRGFWA